MKMCGNILVTWYAVCDTLADISNLLENYLCTLLLTSDIKH